ITKILDPKNLLEDLKVRWKKAKRHEKEIILMRYIKQLNNLNKLLNLHGEVKREIESSRLSDENHELVKKLNALLERFIKPKLILEKERFVEEYQNEFYIIRFIIRRFRKIFFMLKRKRTMSDAYVFKRLLEEIIKKDKKRVLFLLIFVFINSIIGMLIPFLFKGLMDQGFKYYDRGIIYHYGFLFLILSFSGIFLSIISNYMIQYLANKVMFNIRGRMFRNLQNLSLDYYNSQPSGKIISYITNDVETIQQLISSGFLTVFIDVFRLVGSVIFMIIIDWRLTLIAFSIIPLILMLGAVIFKKARRYFVLMRIKIAAVTSHTQESIAGMRVIKAFAIEEKDRLSYERATGEEREINLKAAKLFAMLPGLITSVISLGIAVLLLFSGYFYIQSVLYPTPENNFQYGDLFAFLMYIFQFFGPIIQFVQFVTSIQNSMAAGERIIKLIDAKSSVKEKLNGIDIDSEFFKSIRPDNIIIKFENINFEYEKGVPVLRNINLTTKPSERLALVGYTGAGKTTFTSLLCRFWDVTSGRILINGVDIRNFKKRALRRLMGVVLQDNYLFPGTVMENIKYGKKDATDEEVYEITKKLGIHKFILNLENGYDTQVRERGSRLSAGQKQLITFARALLVDPLILILDEATSSIDPYSEILVKNALDKLLKGRTSITIAHRLSTVLNSDRILVMDNGEIVEQGTHQELVQKEKGLYKHLFSMQFTKLTSNFKESKNQLNLSDKFSYEKIEEN
ncbi:MAG: ABC transporter ATP-binding protein, partial [Promethearchaeota archaeon]